MITWYQVEMMKVFMPELWDFFWRKKISFWTISGRNTPCEVTLISSLYEFIHISLKIWNLPKFYSNFAKFVEICKNYANFYKSIRKVLPENKLKPNFQTYSRPQVRSIQHSNINSRRKVPDKLQNPAIKTLTFLLSSLVHSLTSNIYSGLSFTIAVLEKIASAPHKHTPRPPSHACWVKEILISSVHLFLGTSRVNKSDEKRQRK